MFPLILLTTFDLRTVNSRQRKLKYWTKKTNIIFQKEKKKHIYIMAGLDSNSYFVFLVLVIQKKKGGGVIHVLAFYYLKSMGLTK